MMIRVHATESLLLRCPQLPARLRPQPLHIPPSNHSKLYQSQLSYQKLFHLENSVVSSHSGVTSRPEDYFPPGYLQSKVPDSTPKVSNNGHRNVHLQLRLSLSPTFIVCYAPQCRQLWIVTRFPICDPDSPSPTITALTINQHVQIVQL